MGVPRVGPGRAGRDPLEREEDEIAAGGGAEQPVEARCERDHLRRGPDLGPGGGVEVGLSPHQAAVGGHRVQADRLSGGGLTRAGQGTNSRRGPEEGPLQVLPNRVPNPQLLVGVGREQSVLAGCERDDLPCVPHPLPVRARPRTRQSGKHVTGDAVDHRIGGQTEPAAPAGRGGVEHGAAAGRP